MFSRLREKIKGKLGGAPVAAPSAPLAARPPAPLPVRPAAQPSPPTPPVAVLAAPAPPPPVVAAPVAVAPPVVEAPAATPIAAPSPLVRAPEPRLETPDPLPPVAARPSSLAAAAAAAARSSDKLMHADMGSTDREHYIARAKANNRDISTIIGGEGVNQAADGEAFWGPVDNESSRAKAHGKLLAIDQWECISCGTCVEQTDKVFYLPADAKATPIAQDGPMDLIQDAIEACPVTCIHWVKVEEAADKGFATGNEPDSPRPE
ncbi:hypothetical protein LBMAG42_28650 [Deltaproteobacteria bacterium]|nr:hypothetical protein LBMAG42_28650 [Deltaproteobacteria bacterium]